MKRVIFAAAVAVFGLAAMQVAADKPAPAAENTATVSLMPEAECKDALVKCGADEACKAALAAKGCQAAN